MEKGEQFEKPEEIPEQNIKISEQKREILEVRQEEPKEYIPDKEEINKLKQKINNAFEKNKGEERTDDATNNLSTGEKEKRPTGFKKMGISVGRSFKWVVGLFEDRVDKFEVKHSGAEHLKELEGKPYILAANHIKPRNILMQFFGLSPDSFVLRRVVQEQTGQTPNAIATVSGKIRKIPIIGQIDKLWSPFREGVMEGAGFIPIKTTRGGGPAGFNRNFIKRFRDSVQKKEPAIIFPQGQWDKDFDSDRKFETGAVTLAKNYNLPVVPVYIKGGRSWSSKEKVSVDIGQAIDPTGKTKEEITDEIKKGITDMKEAKEGVNNKAENE